MRFAKLHYNVTEGSNVTIMIIADKPAYTNYSILLTTLTIQSVTAASGKHTNILLYSYLQFSFNNLVDDFKKLAHNYNEIIT